MESENIQTPRPAPAVLVLAPLARDTARMCEFLTGAGICAQACDNIEELCERLSAQRAVVLTAEEALVGSALSQLALTLSRQATGAQVPVLVLVSARAGTQPDHHAQQLLDAFANATLITRPAHPLTLFSAVRTAARAVQLLDAPVSPPLVMQEVEELRAGAATLRLLQAAMKSACVTVFQQDRALRYTRVHNDLAGFAPEQIIGKRNSDLWSAEDADALDAFKREVLTSGMDGRQKFRLHAQDRAHDVEVIAEPLRAESGETVGLTGVVLAIGEHVALQERLRRRADQLVRMDQRKNDFIAQLAHALRGPLAPIHNAMHVLRVQPDPPNRSHVTWATEVIERQVQTLSRLIDDVLDVARVTYGEIALRQEPIELGQLLPQAVEAVRPIATARKQTIAYTAPAELLWVQGERARLAQIVGNLLHNAARYTPAGGHIALVVRRAREEAEIAVTDDGVGLPSDILAHILQSAPHGERALNFVAAGLGLGLVLVKRLVALHGGSIEACSAGVDQGSTFIVRLPLRRPPAPSQPPLPALSAQTSEGLRVLVVDDDPDVAQSFMFLLRLMGHDACAANDGASALEVARAFRPQIAFVDIGLPDTDGYTLAQGLCAMYPEGIRVIAITGYGQDDVGPRAAAAGFETVLLKPATAETVERLLASSV